MMTSPLAPPPTRRARTGLLFATFLAAALPLISLSSLPARAHINSGANCANCHSTARSGMSLTGFQSTTNLGTGALKVFQVTPGQTASIGIQVTDGHNEYGLALVNLDGGGIRNSANHLTYQADSAWTRRTGYYSAGPSGSNKAWTFRLGVGTATPPDFYLLRLRMAGTGGGRWNQEAAFYVQVVKPTPTAPQITDPAWSGGVFSCRVATTTGFTYFLEGRPNGTEGPWTIRAEVAGDGSIKPLADNAAAAPTILYRIRVE
jgi:hypothetical protein